MAALEAIHPYGTYMVPGETTLLKWEYIDLQENLPQRFELHYWLSSAPESGWQTIDDNLSASTFSYVWVAPNDLVEDTYGYIRLTVKDAGDRTNQDYRRFTVQSEANPAQVDDSGCLRSFDVSPNPGRRGIRIRYETLAFSRVTVSVFDVAGRRIKVLANGNERGGMRTLIWDGHDDGGGPVAPGIYFIRIDLGGDKRTIKVVRLQ